MKQLALSRPSMKEQMVSTHAASESFKKKKTKTKVVGSFLHCVFFRISSYYLEYLKNKLSEVDTPIFALEFKLGRVNNQTFNFVVSCFIYY